MRIWLLLGWGRLAAHTAAWFRHPSSSDSAVNTAGSEARPVVGRPAHANTTLACRRSRGVDIHVPLATDGNLTIVRLTTPPLVAGHRHEPAESSNKSSDSSVHRPAESVTACLLLGGCGGLHRQQNVPISVTEHVSHIAVSAAVARNRSRLTAENGYQACEPSRSSRQTEVIAAAVRWQPVYRLYLPRKALQLGQLCSLSIHSSIQHGIRQQPIQQLPETDQG